jgi:two-component system response regulator HydG
MIATLHDRTSTADRGAVSPLIGRHACMALLRAAITSVARRRAAVLICGESGTGKELVARHIHAASPRAAAPFVTVDCTTLRDTLFESQLFGHVKGAFTGAAQATLGLFRAADGGTILFDEIGELDLPMQAKLLRCLQERSVIPLGGIQTVPVDVRILAATNRDLPALVRQGRFREDLFYRINVVRLEVPPLRARRADIPLLAEHFLSECARLQEEPVRRLTAAARAVLERYPWPGNVRELQNAIEHALAFSDRADVCVCDLPGQIRGGAVRPLPTGRAVLPLAVAERLLIKRALRAAGGNRSLAARLLGVERHRLARMIARHGLCRARGAAQPAAAAAATIA